MLLMNIWGVIDIWPGEWMRFYVSGCAANDPSGGLRLRLF
jgi:hypothetical protein